jgi:hypothetical protein
MELPLNAREASLVQAFRRLPPEAAATVEESLLSSQLVTSCYGQHSRAAEFGKAACARARGLPWSLHSKLK